MIKRAIVYWDTKNQLVWPHLICKVKLCPTFSAPYQVLKCFLLRPWISCYLISQYVVWSITLQHISFHLPGELNPGYRGPLQGGSGPAPSSSSLQQKLGMSLDLCLILTGLPKDHICAILAPIACWQDHFNGKTLTCYVSHINRMSSLLAKNYTRQLVLLTDGLTEVSDYPLTAWI